MGSGEGMPRERERERNKWAWAEIANKLALKILQGRIQKEKLGEVADKTLGFHPQFLVIYYLSSICAFKKEGFGWQGLCRSRYSSPPLSGRHQISGPTNRLKTDAWIIVWMDEINVDENRRGWLLPTPLARRFPCSSFLRTFRVIALRNFPEFFNIFWRGSYSNF